MKWAYYNDLDQYTCAWVRQLIAKGMLPDGEVDCRSIGDVQPGDVAGFAQVHFFCGIGGWAYACRLAGWPDDRPIWTGSCPCQPFSVAGRRGGADDARHLWPDFFRLIRAARPPVVMGEQVAGSAGYGWLNGVLADLAGEGYAGRGVDIPACAVDAPHIRSRLYWLAVADAKGAGCEARDGLAGGDDAARSSLVVHDGGNLVHTTSVGRGEGRAEPIMGRRRAAVAGADAPSDLDDANAMRGLQPQGGQPDQWGWHRNADAGRNGTFWSDAILFPCHDGKARRAQPGTPLLVDGLPGRVALWRGFGNAIVPQVAAEVIGAFMDCAP